MPAHCFRKCAMGARGIFMIRLRNYVHSVRYYDGVDYVSFSALSFFGSGFPFSQQLTCHGTRTLPLSFTLPTCILHTHSQIQAQTFQPSVLALEPRDLLHEIFSSTAFKFSTLGMSSAMSTTHYVSLHSQWLPHLPFFASS